MAISANLFKHLSESSATSQLILTTKENATSQLNRWNVSAEAQTEFKGEKGEQFIWYPTHSEKLRKLIFLGLGDAPGIQKFSSTVRSYFHNLKQKDFKQNIAISLPNCFSPEKEIHLILVAAYLGWEPIVSYKKKQPSSESLSIDFIVPKQTENLDNILDQALKTARLKKLVSDWVNMPANYLGPEELAREITHLAQSDTLKATIFEANALKSKGFGGIFGVGKGSSNQPRLIQLEYSPQSFSKSVVLVGKAVMFDTGGVSIKGSTNLHYMKCDMGGGAIALGSVLLAAELNLPVKVTAVVPAVMNMLDGSAYVPGDVLTAYNGLSIEVIDTDAEGRIVLADALAYAALDLKPDILLDFATLTGAAVTALGYHSSALMTKNEHLQEQLIQAGNTSGDRVWPLPLWDEYGEPLASDIADVKNYAGPASGVIFAGKFLEKFTEEHPAWAHLDVAGMVLQQGPFGKDRVATGYGIELVAEFLKSLESTL